MILILIIIIVIVVMSVAIIGGNESLIVRKATARDIRAINILLESGGSNVYEKNITAKKLKYLNRDESHGVYLGFMGGKLVATATIKSVSWGYKSPRLSTTANIIDPEYRGKGLMVKFSLILFDKLREAGETSISSQVAIDNTASRRVMEKLGFVEEFEFENHIFYEKHL